MTIDDNIIEPEITEDMMDIIYDNAIKILAVSVSFLLRKTVYKAWNKYKFYVNIEKVRDSQIKLHRIDRVCDRLLFTLGASRVLFLHIHNGTVTKTNVHLLKITCLNESCEDNIQSIKHTIVNSNSETCNKYVNVFLEKGFLYYNDIALFDDERLKTKFSMDGVTSVFVVMASIRDVPIGFLRVEYCGAKNHSQEFIDKILANMTIESKKIFLILIP